MTALAYSIYFDLPILLAVVSLVYSATRYDDWPHIWSEAVRWGRRMVAFLASIGAVLFILSTFEPWVAALLGAAAAVGFGAYSLWTRA